MRPQAEMVYLKKIVNSKERIIDDLILESLRDITKESEKLITKYMKDYVM